MTATPGQEELRLKSELYFTRESRDTLNSFTLFMTVKTITKLKLRHNAKFAIKM